MNMGKKLYLRKQEKEEIMAVACLSASLRTIVERYENLEKVHKKPVDKATMKNLRSALTFTRKTFESIVEGAEAGVIKDIEDFVSSKEVIITDPKDAQFIRRRQEMEANTIQLNKDEFIEFCRGVNLIICKHCDGSVADSCMFKKVMLGNSAIDGAREYINCPFAKAGQGDIK